MYHLLLAAGIIPVLYCAVSLLRNYSRAKALGVSVIVVPVDAFNIPWFALQNSFRPFLKYLPSALATRFRYVQADASFVYKHGLFAEHGDVHARVSFDKLQIHIADPATAERVLGRKGGVLKTSQAKLLDMWGPTVVSLDGEEWALHRKIMAPPFNEKNFGLVWSETMKQTTQMLQYWDEHGAAHGGTRDLDSHAMTLTLHILTAAGFGLHYDFDSAHEPGADGRRSYRDVYCDLLGSPELAFSVPFWVREWSFLPARLRSYIRSRKEIERYLGDMLAAGKEQALQVISSQSGNEVGAGAGARAKANLLSSLVLKSEQSRLDLLSADETKSTAAGGEKQQQQQQKQKQDSPLTRAPSKRGLSKGEMMSNLLLFGAAGHETTAHTIGFAVYQLLANPQWQEWIAEEIDEVLGPKPQPLETLVYEETFDKLPRIRAVVYETLRLYGPADVILRDTPGEVTTPMQLPSGETIALPPKARVVVDVHAVQTHPCWGPTAHAFNPARWLAPSPDAVPTSPPPPLSITTTATTTTTTTTTSSTSSAATTAAGESQIQLPFQSPPRGVPKHAFMAWGDGPRICPGRKFALVEVVGVLTGLLWGARLEVVPEGKEGAAEARQRVLETLADSTRGLTLEMRRPKRVAVRRVVREVVEC